MDHEIKLRGLFDDTFVVLGLDDQKGYIGISMEEEYAGMYDAVPVADLKAAVERLEKLMEGLTTKPTRQDGQISPSEVKAL